MCWFRFELYQSSNCTHDFSACPFVTMSLPGEKLNTNQNVTVFALYEIYQHVKAHVLLHNPAAISSKVKRMGSTQSCVAWEQLPFTAVGDESLPNIHPDDLRLSRASLESVPSFFHSLREVTACFTTNYRQLTC